MPPRDFPNWTLTQALPTVINADHFKNMILTQAPLPSTRADFWKMAHQMAAKNVGVVSADVEIVMLTEFVESGVRKADPYLPFNEDNSLSPVVASVIDTVVDNDVLVRRVVKVTHGDVEHILYHTHFKRWSDHGVPTMSEMRALLGAMHSLRKPMIMHCSAGVGRAGTLAAIVECINTGKTPFEVVSDLRQHRAGAVMTVEQYQFICEFVKEYSFELTVLG
jgi:protein tyrosine phosphatase